MKKMVLGNKIRELRTLRGLTQEELANRCELTKGYISQLENDLTEPAISTLEDILLALGTNFKEFFSDFTDDKIIFKQEDYFEKEEDGTIIKWLVTNSQKNEMEPILIELKKGTSTEKDLPHEGEEFGYILEGEIELILGTNKYICTKGETFYFISNKTHYIKNHYNGISKIIWVSSPPNF